MSKFINIPKFLVISIEDRVCNFFLSDFWGGWHDKCYRWNFVTWRTKFLLLVMKTECYSRVNDFLNYILMLLCCYHFIWEKENWSLEFDIWFDNLWRRTFTNVLKIKKAYSKVLLLVVLLKVHLFCALLMPCAHMNPVARIPWLASTMQNRCTFNSTKNKSTFECAFLTWL